MVDNNNKNLIIIILVVVAVVAIAVAIDSNEKPSSKLGKAVDEVAEGIDDAADELNPERRTTGEKIGDAVEDMGNDIKGRD